MERLINKVYIRLIRLKSGMDRDKKSSLGKIIILKLRLKLKALWKSRAFLTLN
jgi:hypothetical protein